MPPLECVPNVSEGRRPEVIARLVAALSGHPSAALLDASHDPDHNRSVFTLAGDASGLETALVGLYRVALAEIDLDRHQGVHPRVGAVDVVPFVPLGDTPMTAAIDAARSLGRRVAAEFDLPVFLYEAAATAPHRRRLPDLRRGGPAALAARIEASASGAPGAEPWLPDFGPPRLHPTAGATIVGARDLLIAANALLDTPDLAVAQSIARAIRTSSGGLPAVRALGLLLPSRGLAQVSMNLLDYRVTSPAVAFSAIAREAARHGARIVERELIGLVPDAALAGSGEGPDLLRKSWSGRTVESRLRIAGVA